MKRITPILIVLSFLLISCNKNETVNENNSYSVTVLGRGLDCGDAYLIKFDNDVSGLPENTFDNTFYEINLPDEYKIEGMKIKVEFREPANDEIMVCTTMGIGYPQIYITKVE